MRADAYPHRCESVELIETHISWVLLAGEYAYKIKKPVDFGFLDFSTLERRQRFCEAELRLNRRFAESLYVDVLPVMRANGRVRFAGAGAAESGAPDDGDVIDYAVRMRRFPSEMQLDRRLEAAQLPTAELAEFGAALARVHATLPIAAADVGFGTPDAVLEPVRENFVQIRQSAFSMHRRERVDVLDAWSAARHAQLAPLLDQRLQSGFVRECHGDLHLSNLVKLDDAIHAFDCIEFSESLRWIDLISDVAFLTMDCCVRGRADLGYAFLDRYLEQSGDYAGGALLDFYLVYRSLVRAKVAALQAQRSDDVELLRRFDTHLDFALAVANIVEKADTLWPRPAMIVMCGVSGSGKSWLAKRLVERVGAIRIRSDVERKRMAALKPLQRSASPLDQGLYAPQATDALYAHLARSARALVDGGARVIVDATCLTVARRESFRTEARRRGVACLVVHCFAPHDVLVERISTRNRANDDPSEADVDVLEAQSSHYEPPSVTDETVLNVDTSQRVDVEAIARHLRAAIDPRDD